MTQLAEFEGMMDRDDDLVLADRTYGFEGVDCVDNTTNDMVGSYYNSCYNNIVMTTSHQHVFINDSVTERLALSQHRHQIDSWWILLDNQSTIDLFGNKDLLTDIREVDDYVTVHCNAGKINVYMMGNLPVYSLVWYYPKAIANILSLFLVVQRFHIEYDSRLTGAFLVWTNDDTCRRFNPGPRGLFYADYKCRSETTLVLNDHKPYAVTTVQGNLARLNQRQINEAKTARKMQETAGLSTKSM